jgi:hypothetical protein
MPASDRIVVEGSVVKHKYEGIYAKALVADGDILGL